MRASRHDSRQDVSHPQNVDALAGVILGGCRNRALRACVARIETRINANEKARAATPACGSPRPCHAAIPHPFGLSAGRSAGWLSSNPTCGYPAVQQVFGCRGKSFFIEQSPSGRSPREGRIQCRMHGSCGKRPSRRVLTRYSAYGRVYSSPASCRTRPATYHRPVNWSRM